LFGGGLLLLLGGLTRCASAGPAAAAATMIPSISKTSDRNESIVSLLDACQANDGYRKIAK
jgi:hypothetical protein